MTGAWNFRFSGLGVQPQRSAAPSRGHWTIKLVQLSLRGPSCRGLRPDSTGAALSVIYRHVQKVLLFGVLLPCSGYHRIGRNGPSFRGHTEDRPVRPIRDSPCAGQAPLLLRSGAEATHIKPGGGCVHSSASRPRQAMNPFEAHEGRNGRRSTAPKERRTGNHWGHCAVPAYPICLTCELKVI